MIISPAYSLRIRLQRPHEVAIDERDRPGLPKLGLVDLQNPALEVEVRNFKVHDLLDAQPPVVQAFEDAAIAEALRAIDNGASALATLRRTSGTQ